jgi:GAF domain-containing protein
MGEGRHPTSLTVEQTEEMRRAGLFRFVAWLILALAVLVLIVFVVLGLLNPAFSFVYLGSTAVAFIVCDLVALWQSYRGHHTRAGTILLVGLTAGIFVVVHFADGATGPFAPAIIALPIVAATFGGRRIARWMAGGVLLLYVALFALEQTGVLPAQSMLGPARPYVGGGMLVLLVIAITSMVTAFIAQMHRALEAAQQSGQRLIVANRQAQQAAEAEREARQREIKAAQQLRVTVQQYVEYLEQIAAGNYGVQLTLPEMESEALGARELRTLGDYLNTTVETLVRALTDMQTLQRRYTSESWSDVSGVGIAGQGLQYKGAEIVPADRNWSSAMERAVREKGTAVQDEELALPILLGGEVIGVIGARREGDGARVRWSDGELSIVRAATDQLAQTIETLRLLDETQRSAARERTVGEITANLARSLDVEAVLQTVVRELGQTLPVDEVSVWVGPQDLSTPEQPGEENR